MAVASGKFRGAIFDMDGVIICNMKYHEDAFYEFGRRHNIEISREFFFEHICGSTNPKIMRKLFGDALSDEDVQAFGAEKERIYQELYTPNLRAAEGLIEFLNHLKQQGIGMAIASNGPPENVHFVVETLGLREWFSHVLHVQSVANPKPAPDMFLKCAELLGVAPHEAVVFEDAPSGIRCARNAGMTPIALLTTHELHEFDQPQVFVKDFLNPIGMSFPFLCSFFLLDYHR